ncbi:MAG: dihydropteroate synthase [Weeksellaceae bacterium]
MTIQTKGKLLDLSKPQVMGILNLTPDSFHDGGQNNDLNSALSRIEKMLKEGATIIDIGGQSTRPGANFLNADEELNVLFPFLNEIIKNFPETIFSIDTFWGKVAQETVDAGVAIVNDVSAGTIDNDMFKIVAALKVPYILMHMQGTPQTMQNNPHYENIVLEVNEFYSTKINELKALGINDIILDPGYGFGKTVQHNYQLLKNQELLGFGEYLILAGVSRKSMVTKVLNIKNKEALNGTTALHMLALIHGANILRVHDVTEAIECIKIFEAYKQA